jgi:hypothetical protein
MNLFQHKGTKISVHMSLNGYDRVNSQAHLINKYYYLSIYLLKFYFKGIDTWIMIVNIN